MDGSPHQRRTRLLADLRRLAPQPQCRLCRQAGAHAGLCSPCRLELQPPCGRCLRCALPLPGRADRICGECLQQPPAFTRSLCAFDYRAPVSDWINRFKHHRDLRDGHLLAAHLATTVSEAYCEDLLPEALVPVPLHWRRQLQRSFNQAAWIARCLQRQLELPLLPALCRRSGGHRQQALGRQARQHNLGQVFALRAGADVRGSYLALVDDVVTTTATARSLSALLLDAGARRVDVWCLARTPRER